MKYSLTAYFRHAFVNFEINSFSHANFQEMLAKYGPPIRVMIQTSDDEGRTVYLSEEDEKFAQKYLGEFQKESL